MIYIRADGSARIGVGHLMRCMTIAEQLQREEEICFLTGSAESAALIREKGYPVRVLTVQQNFGLEEELQMQKLLEKEKPGALLVDSYEVTDSYFKKLRSCTQIAYLDDFGEQKYSVDKIFNYNVFADLRHYQKLYAGSDTELFIGKEFIPVRTQFAETPYEVRKDLKHVLLMTGGGDFYHLEEKFLPFILQETALDFLEFHIISGYYNREFHRQCRKLPGRIHIYENVAQMWELMQKCDCAISAGGTTVYELCTMGVPFMGYSFADNQKPVLSYLQKQDIAPYCGDYREKQDNLFDSFKEQLLLFRDHELRQDLHQKEIQMVDGRGAKRIARMLLQ